ncbi:MAG TPA: hypothetical protein VKE74_16210 [Gemmataceae bacterium]|nr:hypothetical protein [Gemmataceae bacterium]
MEEAASMLRPSELPRKGIIETLAHEDPNLIQPSRKGGQGSGPLVFAKPLNGATLDDSVERTRAHRTV